MPLCGVCLSVTFVNSIKMSSRMHKICSPSGSETILAFPYQTSWQYSDGDHLTGASNAGRGGGTTRDFGQHLAIDRWLPKCAIHNWRWSSVQWCITVTVHVCLRHRDRHASVNTPKRREENKIYLYAAVNLKTKQLITEDCARRIALLNLTTDRHEARAASPRQLSFLSSSFSLSH